MPGYEVRPGRCPCYGYGYGHGCGSSIQYPVSVTADPRYNLAAQ